MNMDKNLIKRINEAARRLENASLTEESAWYRKFKKAWEETSTVNAFTKGKKPRLSTIADDKLLSDVVSELNKYNKTKNVGQVRKSLHKGFETFKSNKAAQAEAKRRGIEITEDTYRKARKAMSNLIEDQKEKFGSDIFIIATMDLEEGYIDDTEISEIFQRIGEQTKFDDEIKKYLGEYGSIEKLIDGMESW